MSTTRAGTGRRVSGVAIGAAALGVGLFALIGIRVKETLAERKALAGALAEQVKTAPKRAGATIVHPVAKTWRPTIPVTGTLAPLEEADVGFKTSGRLTSVRVKVGDRVKRGQQLAALDMSEASAQAAATSAGVRAAQISYDMAKDNEKRTAALFEQHAISDAENLNAQNRATLAAAQLEQARAQAQLAAVGVGNGSLAAPFAGLVTRAPNGIGMIVTPGEALFHLSNTSVLELKATLSQGDARLVEVGAEVVVDAVAAAAPAEGAPPAGGSTVARGAVTAVLGSLDPETRRVPMRAEIPNSGAEALLAGAFVRATVRSSHEVRVLELPPGSLRPGSQDEVVTLVGGKAHLVHVVFSQGEAGAILVRDGVSTSDAVVLNPSPEVREGDEIATGS